MRSCGRWLTRPACGHRVKPAEVRFYFDADILGLGKVLAALRADVTYPGDPGATIHKKVRPPCLVTSPRTDDDVWITAVTRTGLLVITRDSKIQKHQAELDAVRHSRARMVTLSSVDAATTWGQLEVVMRQWRRIEELHELPGRSSTPPL